MPCLSSVCRPLALGIIDVCAELVPYIGFIIALVPPTVLALIEINPYAALLVVIVASIVNLFSENVLFPELAGRGMELSPAIYSSQ